jgi:hypothetical protein
VTEFQIERTVGAKHSRSNLSIFKIALFWECFAQNFAMWGQAIAEGGEDVAFMG